MQSYLPILIDLLVSTVTLIVFFFFYVRNFTFPRPYIIQTRAFFLGLLTGSLTLFVQSVLPESDSRAYRALVHAAFIEEATRAVFIYVRARMSSDRFSLMEGIFDGILIGLGFAFAENLHYGYNYSGVIIILRSITSVPLHVFASGIMAYYFSYGHLCRPQMRPATGDENDRRSGVAGRRIRGNRLRRAGLYLHGFVLAWIIHGMYDLAFLSGGRYVYLIPFILIAAFFFLEYLIAHARLIFPKNVLLMIGVNADDVDILLQQQEYEQWIEREQKEITRPHLILSNWRFWNVVIGALFLILALAAMGAYVLFPEIYKPLRIPGTILISLFGVFPATLGIIILVSDNLNYLFLRDWMIRMPLTASAQVYGPDVPSSAHLVLDIQSTGVFLNGDDAYRQDQVLRLRFQRPGRHRQAEVNGRIVWSNRYNRTLPVGHICRFENRGLRFSFFRWRFRISGVLRRIRMTVEMIRTGSDAVRIDSISRS